MAATATLPLPSTPVASSPTPERPPTPEPPPLNSYVIFDWDDTLLASTWLASRGIRLDVPAVLPPDVVTLLDTLQKAVVGLLEKALRLGPVCIVTNAETGWVQLSAKRFMPAVEPLLSRVRVLSARSTFEPVSDCPSEWKVRAFHQVLSEHYVKADPLRVRNVVSFGDSIHERHAVHKVTTGVPNTLTKSVKFVERPSAEQLNRQIELVSGCIGDIVDHGANLDLMLTIQLLAGDGGAAPATA